MPAGVACPPTAWRPPARAGAGPWAQQCDETKDSPHGTTTFVAAARGMQAGVETQGSIIWSTGTQGVLLLAVLPQRGFSPQFLVGFLEAELGAPAEPTGVHHFLPTCLLHRLAPHPCLPSQAGRAV
ncbi:uncharacterized protein LOC144155874 [Haemaphysalis longicornis]